HAKSRKTMWVGHVQRNVDEACADVAFSDQAENDASNADVRPHDVDEHHRHQCEEPIAAANGGLQWPQRRGGEQQQRGHDRAEHDRAERDSAVHQQPHDDQHDEEDRGDAPHHAPPASATVSGSVASTASMYVCGDINPSAAACKNAMTGSAAIVKPTQSSTSTATGAASITRRRGVLRPTTLQNSRIPIRVNATSAASPVHSIAAMKTHECTPFKGAISTAADSSANLAMNPDSGGNPATSNAQLTNARPRKAIAAGIAMPTSSSTSSGSCESSIPNAEYETCGSGA